MDWINKQPSWKLALFGALIIFNLTSVLFSFTAEIAYSDRLILSSVLSVLTFLISWLLLRMMDSSIKVFQEIEGIRVKAEAVSTRKQHLEVRDMLDEIIDKSQHSGHYQRIREIQIILNTKFEYLK